MAAPSHTAKLQEAFAYLRRTFPNIDSALTEYVEGVLAGGLDDIHSEDEMFEAIGFILTELKEDQTEQVIRDVCSKVFHIVIDQSSPTAEFKQLSEPIHLLSQIGDMKLDNNVNFENIFMEKKRANSSQVDLKKLEKAEAKIKQKQEKRNQAASKVIIPVHEDKMATASQQTSRKDDRLEQSGQNRSSDIRLENFDIGFGEKVLLKSADLIMAFGRRYGLVGRNGIGKTTLLRMLAMKELRIQSHISILHVEQEVVGDDTIALESVLECDEKRYNLLKEEKQLEAQLNALGERGSDSKINSRIAEIYHELDEIDADMAPSKASVILCGLGFSTYMQKMPTKEFSGGWRMRLALARALFSIPDLLLLDEPTNMLDMKAIIWLETYLQTWPTTILVVSHDRQFLNTIVTDVLHLHTQTLNSYHGDYEAFVRTRDDRLKNQIREYEAQKTYRDHIMVFINRFRYNANRAAQVQSKLKLLEKLPEVAVPQKEVEVNLRFCECTKLSGQILTLDEMSFSYENSRVIFDNLCVSANADSRICIVGENGAGKSTLLKILLGTLEPTKGFRHAHRSLRLGYFSQHHVDQLDMTMNSIEVMQSKVPGHTSEFYRTQLGSFGVTGELATRSLTSLSGGQKSRVAFAQMASLKPNFFILDEPTNHLDMETIEALGRAINKFEGGVILVSHDERLISLICNELWFCTNKGITVLEGGLNEYKEIVKCELEDA